MLRKVYHCLLVYAVGVAWGAPYSPIPGKVSHPFVFLDLIETVLHL